MDTLILSIDDSLTVRKIMEATMRRAGYRAISFPDGPAAFRWLASPEGNVPALIIVDLSLPNMDGFTVIHRLKASQRLRQVPVIILTGREGVIDRLKGRLAGACEYVVKPFTTQQIVTLVRAHLGEPDKIESNEGPAIFK